MDSSEINEYVHNALVATEDFRFYEHKGIDYKSLMRVLVKSILLMDKSSGGGSTITQQLAKNVFGRKKRYLLATPINKIREMIIARRLEHVYSKDEILLLYLNTVPFGERLYGLEKASNRFFGKNPSKLTLEEAATIIGLLKATSYYNPNNNPENATRRRNTVLRQMLKYGYLDSLTFQKAKESELKLNYTKDEVKSTFAAYYKDYLRAEFDLWAKENPKKDGSLYNLDEDGLTIYTSIHASIQRSVEKAVDRQMIKLQEYFKEGWSSPLGKDSLVKSLILQNSKARALQENGLSNDSIYTIFNKRSI